MLQKKLIYWIQSYNNFHINHTIKIIQEILLKYFCIFSWNVLCCLIEILYYPGKSCRFQGESQAWNFANVIPTIFQLKTPISANSRNRLADIRAAVFLFLLGNAWSFTGIYFIFHFTRKYKIKNESLNWE